MTQTSEDEDPKKEIQRIIARAIWYGEYDKANPKVSPEERQMAWLENRARMIAIGVGVLAALEAAAVL